ncbi:MAG TPA: allantoate amidohydrolase [Microbacterium sp.]|nr:allantoate amidohydrolase [Microbacterium sp.]
MTATELLAQIADIGRDPVRGGYSRHLFDDADLALRKWFADRAQEQGLRLEQDGNANMWAWWDAGGTTASAAPAVVTGSHLDSVPGGGAYDGPLGVVSALAAVQALREEGFAPSRPIAVCVFAEEEGGRFNAPCLGSRLLVGDLGLPALADRVDAAGHSFAEVWAGAGRDVDRIGADPARLASIGVFVELHVEQGLDLAHRGAPVAVAEGILAHGRWRATFTGEGNHAGTTPMDGRRDPVVAAAQAVLAVRRIAAASGSLVRGTVGRVAAVPGGSNVIASRAQVWVDVRAAQEGEVRAAVARLAAELTEIAAAEGCDVELVEESFSPRVDFDPVLRARLARLLGDVPVIPTGAGHDAGILSAHVPSAMLFVRNPTGVSHAPGESAEAADIEAGVGALTAVLRELAGARG